MLEVQLGGVEGIRFQRPAVRLEIAVAEGGQGQAQQAGDRCLPPRRSAVELHEFDDTDAGRQLDQALLEPQEQVFDLGGLGLGLGLADLTDGEGVPLTSIAELAVPAVALALNGSHGGCPPGQRHRDATPTVAEELQKGRLRLFYNSS